MSEADRDRDRNRKTEMDRPDNESDPIWNKSSSKMNIKGNKSQVIPEPVKKKPVDDLLTRTGGAYIPPARLKLMQKDIEDKSSAAYQRLAWEALKKSINGLINKVNTSNIAVIVRELFKENLIRGRGLLSRSIMQAQAASPTFTNVYAALLAIINTKFPNIGEVCLKRLIIQFRRGYRRNDKTICLTAAQFIGHLVNQQVAHEVVALEILTLLLEHPTEDSVEVAIAFLKEVGSRLEEISPKGSNAIFERLRHVLHEAALEKRVQYMIEVMFQVRKDKFKDFIPIPQELDLVEESDQFTHTLTLDDVDFKAGMDMLNVFRIDEHFLVNEEKYVQLQKGILDESDDDSEGRDDDDEDGDGDGDVENSDADDVNQESATKYQQVVDQTQTNLTALRRIIYLTIQSSLDFEECCHKLLKLNLKEGEEVELSHMILDCCAQQRTYEKFFGLLAGRFCAIHQKYVIPYEQVFKDTFDTVHRLDTNKLRNVSKFFAHLLFTDSISWAVVEHIRLTEEATSSSSRIFVKILMLELCEYMGLRKLHARMNDPVLASSFANIFPRDHARNTRFAINFFTSIGLGGLTDELRDHLKTMPIPTAVVPPQSSQVTVEREQNEQGPFSSSSSSSSSSESSSISSSSSPSSSLDEEDGPKRKKRRFTKKKSSSSSSKNNNNNKKKKKHSQLKSKNVKKEKYERDKRISDVRGRN